MRKRLGFFLITNLLILLMGFYIAFAGTNDCDHGVKVALLSSPGYVFLILSFLEITSRIKFSFRSFIWVRMIFLILGYVALGAFAYYLSESSVMDC